MYVFDFWNLPGWIALISAFLVVGQLIFTLIFGGINLDVDINGDGFGDFDLGTLISPKGIIHFLFGASWYLVLIKPLRLDGWLWYDWLISIGVGIVTSLLVVLLYYWMSKLECDKKRETGEKLVGRAATIYFNSGNGNYDVSIVCSGMTTTIQVTSISKKLDYKVGESVELVKYENGIYFIN